MNLPRPESFTSWTAWAAKLIEILHQPTQVRPVQLAVFPMAKLPQAPADGLLIYVPDDVGGGTPAFSQGGIWRRTSDRAQVSAS